MGSWLRVFGSEIAAEWVRGILVATPAVQAATQGRIYALSIIPSQATTPAVLHYAESAVYGNGPVHGAIDSETLRYVVRFACTGQSTDPILAAAEASIAALNAASGSIGIYHLNSLAIGEWPLTTIVEENMMYRQLGTYYQLEVLKMGA